MEIEVLYHHDNFVQSVIYLRLIMVSPIDKHGAYTLYFSSVYELQSISVRKRGNRVLMDVKITLFPLHGHIILDAPASEKDSKQC